jgi:carbonic anhydrase
MCAVCGSNFGLSRRAVLTGVTCVAAAVMAPAWLGTVSPAAAQTPVSPAEAAQRLAEGNARYVGGAARNTDYSVGRAERALGQTPYASIVSCADSRVAPELVFDEGPGDLFVVRIAGNFVDEAGLASLEFGSAVLGSGLIMVLGHTACGAIQATIDVVQKGTELPGHLPALATALRPGVEKAIAENPADLLAAATAENVRFNVAYLKTAKPIIADLVASGKLDIVGGVYDIATGKVTMV